MKPLFRGATENLACFILINASKLHFNDSYSDELRSPQELKFPGALLEVVRFTNGHQKSPSNERLFRGATENRRLQR